MNQQYDNRNKGAAFPVREKRENSPDYSGQLDVNGVPYRVFIRKKKSSKQGKELLELSIIPDNKPQYQPSQGFVPPQQGYQAPQGGYQQYTPAPPMSPPVAAQSFLPVAPPAPLAPVAVESPDIPF